MLKLFMRALSAFNVWVYRVSGGKVMGKFPGGAPVLLLTTKGRKSGRARTVPLLYLGDGDAVILVASQGGAPEHPAWFANLQSDPKCGVEIGRRAYSAMARRVSDAEKSAYWPRLVAIYPAYADYQKRTSRDIPVIAVTSA